MKKLFVVALLALCALCGPRMADAAQGGRISQINKVAAVVNGKVITMFDLQKAAVPDLVRARISPSNPAQAQEMDRILRSVLDGMIMDILMEQELVRLKGKVQDSEIDAELATIMKTNGMTRAQFRQRLEAQKIPLEELRGNLRRQIIRRKIMGQEVARKVVVTNEEIAAYYEAHKQELFRRDGLHMALLVYHPKAPAAATAAQIRSGAMSFEEASRRFSVAPNREKGGDMGPVEWERLNPEWEKRLATMRAGDVTDIFTLNGFKAQVRLFRPGASGPDAPMTLAEATPIIDGILRRPKAEERFAEYSRRLRSRAVIDIRL